MKRLENVDGKQATKLIKTYGLKEWLTNGYQVMHYIPNVLVKEMIEHKMPHFR